MKLPPYGLGSLLWDAACLLGVFAFFEWYGVALYCTGWLLGYWISLPKS